MSIVGIGLGQDAQRQNHCFSAVLFHQVRNDADAVAFHLPAALLDRLEGDSELSAEPACSNAHYLPHDPHIAGSPNWYVRSSASLATRPPLKTSRPARLASDRPGA